MKLKYLALFVALLLFSAPVFASDGDADILRVIKPLGLVSSEASRSATAAASHVFVAEIIDTVIKTVTTADDRDTTTLISSIYIDPTFYVGWEVIYQILDAHDSMVVNDSCLPMIYASIDGTNWDLLPTAEVFKDTLVGASEAAVIGLYSIAKKLYNTTTLASTITPDGPYLRLGVQYVGNNEDAARRGVKWRITLRKILRT